MNRLLRRVDDADPALDRHWYAWAALHHGRAAVSDERRVAHERRAEAA
eukprot:CAMPEP_0183362250 /NCGR_PEP_ID=MMETSP0164_2-20130417/67965_1 /TAXON_ID=221442 /ORGANISM="Coccolithus pelagicus ssp braarudi, Strain PLY182g" /LENGTH=47 /DNA_ID= /DNA_START= /DNA_END= /DNA_ORIENTATION=